MLIEIPHFSYSSFLVILNLLMKQITVISQQRNTKTNTTKRDQSNYQYADKHTSENKTRNCNSIYRSNSSYDN